MYFNYFNKYMVLINGLDFVLYINMMKFTDELCLSYIRTTSNQFKTYHGSEHYNLPATATKYKTVAKFSWVLTAVGEIHSIQQEVQICTTQYHNSTAVGTHLLL